MLYNVYDLIRIAQAFNANTRSAMTALKAANLSLNSLSPQAEKLHNLHPADEMNRQLAERNFMAATGVAYNFWLYELCDVYIVSRSYWHVHLLLDSV